MHEGGRHPAGFLSNLSRFRLAPGVQGSYLAPTQQRTCLWPSWLRNDVKRSGNRTGRWFVRPFRQLTPAAWIRRASSQGRPGAMTPKIARFLSEQQPATPCLVLDVDRVEAEFPRPSARLAARADLLRGEGQSGPSGAGAPGPPRLQLRCGQLRGGRHPAWTPARTPRRSATATPSRRLRRSGPRSSAACRCLPSIPPRSWRSWRSTRPARGCTAASWWRTRVPTGHCRANSAPR